MSAPSEPPQVHGDGLTPPSEGAGAPERQGAAEPQWKLVAVRLVEAAEKAIDGHHKAHLGEARSAVVAVLRELTAAATRPEVAAALLDLADSIEVDGG